MNQKNGKKIVIVGGGIAGLCAAVYGLKCGYDVEVVEMADMAGGLAMSWRRGAYTFETCLHWLLGSRPGGEFHALWQEIFAIEKLKFIDPDEMVRIVGADGDELNIYTDPGRLEMELLRRAPQDGAAIGEFVDAVRALGRFKLLDPAQGLVGNWHGILHDLPLFPLMRRLGRMNGAQYGARFSDPLVRSFFSTGDIGKLTAIAMVLSLAWMADRNAGYCIGGSQAIIRAIEQRIAELGGQIRFRARVEKILVANDTAVGVQLAGGGQIPADWVISAADGHSTIFDMLGGKYADKKIRSIYEKRETFSSYLQVSLGIARDLSDQPFMASYALRQPLEIDPGTQVSNVGFRLFHFDPTFAPPGKTAVTTILQTRNTEFWTGLRTDNPTEYHARKRALAEAVISILDEHIPGGVRQDVEVIDVSTPATILRYTGNWKGSQEGWLLKSGEGMGLLPNTLPGLERFMMVGQWVLPGGGLPCGPITARPALRAICRKDDVPFTPAEERVEEREAVGV